MKLTRLRAIAAPLSATSTAVLAQVDQTPVAPDNVAVDAPDLSRSSDDRALSRSLASHVKSTYARVILTTAEAEPLVERYTKDLDGRVNYDFEMPAIKARMIGITSPHGNISAQITDSAETYDQWRLDTKLLYEVDDVPATLRDAQAAGFKIVQPLSRTPMVWQGRYEVVPGFVVEVVKWLPGKEPQNG
ncbi:hypothetical protein H3V53_12020 [Paraburkholderia bengalensis]|uniref:VOC domain-containing protein n=1 Tax=Paraburkholderia bengalensis TaxID=2747562 RepID=A0ABU8IR32_9BURK